MEKRKNRLQPRPRPKARKILEDKFSKAEALIWKDFEHAVKYFKEWEGRHLSEIAGSAKEPGEAILNKTDFSEKPKDSDAELSINWERWIYGFVKIWKRQTHLNSIAITALRSTSDRPLLKTEQAKDFNNKIERYRLNLKDMWDVPITKWMSDVLESIEMIYEEGERCGYYLDWVDFKYTIEYDHDGVPEPHHELLQPHELCQKLMLSNKHILDCVATIEKLLPFELDSLNPNNPTMISDRYAGIESSCNSAIKDGSVNAKIDDNSNISDCVVPIEESTPLDHNSLKPNNSTMTYGGYTDIESSCNSATLDGSVNAETDDNSKAREKLNSIRTPRKGVKRKISDKVPEKSRRLLHTLSLIAGDTGTGPNKTYDILKAIEGREKNLPEKERRARRTHTQDIKILYDCGLIRKDRGSYYSITENGLKDVKRFKSDDQNKNPSESNNLKWFTKKWHND